VLLAAALAALVWVNVDASSYDAVWRAPLSIRVSGAGITQDLRAWVNGGLMAFFSSWSASRRGESSTSASCGSGGA